MEKNYIITIGLNIFLLCLIIYLYTVISSNKKEIKDLKNRKLPVYTPGPQISVNDIDLSDYYNKREIDNKVSEITVALEDDIIRNAGVSELGYEIDNAENEIIFNRPVRFKDDIRGNTKFNGDLEINEDLDLSGDFYVGPTDINRGRIYVNDNQDIVYGTTYDADNLGFMISQDNIPSIKSNQEPIKFFVQDINTMNSTKDKYQVKTNLEIRSPTNTDSDFSNELVYDIDNITGYASHYPPDSIAVEIEEQRLERIRINHEEFDSCLDYCENEGEARSIYDDLYSQVRGNMLEIGLQLKNYYEIIDNCQKNCVKCDPNSECL